MDTSTRADRNKSITALSVRGNNRLRLAVTLLVLIFPTATLFINRGDSYTLGLLSLIGIWVWIQDAARPWLDRRSATLWIVFALFFAVAILSYLAGYQTEDGFHFLGRDLRFLFIAPVYLAIRRYTPTAKTVFIGLAVGAFISGVLALLQFLHAHVPIRVAATTDLSIIFGDLATTMVLCTVAGFSLLAASRRRWTVPLLVLCLAGGVAATLLSGTRGAWIPLLLLPLALITPLGGFLKHRYVFAIVLVLVAVFSSSYLVTRSGTHTRLTDAVRSLHDYRVVLRTFDPAGTQSALQAGCLNQRIFLGAWLDAAHPAGSVSPQVSLAAAPGLDETTDAGTPCAPGYVLRIHNPDTTRVAQYVFPRAPEVYGGNQHTSLLVRGAGMITFAGGLGKGASINTPRKYTKIFLTSHQAPGKAINVFVGPGNTLSLVPVDSYVGEYSFAIADTSVGQRLEMWRAAWKLFLQHPWLGVGTGAYQIQTQQLIHAGVIAPFAGVYDHPHNDYLDALSSRGIIGFLALLALLLIPAWRFLQATRSPCRITHTLGMGGLLTVAGFAIYALTDTIFLHSMMITWYVIYMALFYALLAAQTGKFTDSKPSE